jgi:hypothetical protein
VTAVAALYVDARGPYPRIASGDYSGAVRTGVWHVDVWDVTRDARQYDGPHPIVAHPPCKHWGRLRHLADRCAHCRKPATCRGAYEGRGEAYACDDCCGHGCEDGRCEPAVSDADCAPRAVEQVRKWGGVLEHPAGSKLWEHCGLPVPDFEVHPRSRLGVMKVLRVSTARDWFGAFVDDFGGYTIELDQVEWGHVARKRTWLYLVGVPRGALEAPPFPGREPTHYASGGRTQSSRKGAPVPAGIKVCSAQQRRRTPPLFAEYLIRLARSVRRP